jgi:hypothetical protein
VHVQGRPRDGLDLLQRLPADDAIAGRDESVPRRHVGHAEKTNDRVFLGVLGHSYVDPPLFLKTDFIDVHIAHTAAITLKLNRSTPVVAMQS